MTKRPKHWKIDPEEYKCPNCGSPLYIKSHRHSTGRKPGQKAGTPIEHYGKKVCFKCNTYRD